MSAEGCTGLNFSREVKLKMSHGVCISTKVRPWQRMGRGPRTESGSHNEGTEGSGTKEPRTCSRKEVAGRASTSTAEFSDNGLHQEGEGRGLDPPGPRAHLLICSSICFTSSDSPPLSPPGPGVALGPPSLGSTAPLSSNERPSSDRTRLDRMSRMVSV